MEVNTHRSFKDLFKNTFFNKLDKFCDVTVVAEDGSEFRAHKLLLSKRSEYFKTFFKTEVGKQNDVAVLPFDKTVVDIILVYIYTGEVPLNNQNIVSLVLAADYLLMDALLTLCKYFTTSNLSLESCMSLLAISYIIERLGITENCYRFVQIHFGNLVDNYSSDIAKLPIQAFIKLLNDDSLGITDEETVWKAIVCWVTGYATERLKYVPQLLSCVRWADVDYCLASRISLHPIIQENSLCKITDLKQLIDTSKEVSLESDRFKLLSNRCPRKMYIFVCRKPFPHLMGADIFLTYDSQLDIWRKIGEVDTSFHTLVATGKLVFMFNAVTNEMQTFDLLRKKWVEKRSRATRQTSFHRHIVQSRNRIFAVGGYVFSPGTQLSSVVEYYDPTTGIWSCLTPLPTMHVCGAAVVKEMLYVIGYLEDPEGLEMKAVVYDAVCDVWSDIERPKRFRTNFAIINFSDRLYILGGETESNIATSSVEAYSPKSGVWEECPRLPIFYDQPRAVILNDQLVIYDDCPISMSAVSRCPACVWKEETEHWKVQDMFSTFSDFQLYEFCSIEDRSTVRELTKENRASENVWTKTPFRME